MYFSQNLALYNKSCSYTFNTNLIHSKQYRHSTKNEVKKHIINELTQSFLVFSYI